MGPYFKVSHKGGGLSVILTESSTDAADISQCVVDTHKYFSSTGKLMFIIRNAIHYSMINSFITIELSVLFYFAL